MRDYNVRVVNLSIGMPAINSYKFDPLCVAARALVDRGIVVVAAAGNNGKNSAGQKVYGQIHSPGNEPSVMTVGAVDTRGTDHEATTRSRPTARVVRRAASGPTRNGVKHYDNLIKPEISAPGNKTIFAQSPNNLPAVTESFAGCKRQQQPDSQADDAQRYVDGCATVGSRYCGSDVRSQSDSYPQPG
jgi:serine protease AprX